MTVVPWLKRRYQLLLCTLFQFSMLQDAIRRLISCVEKPRFIKNSLLSTSPSQSRNDEHGLDIWYLIWYMPRICAPKIMADTCTSMLAADHEDGSARWDLLRPFVSLDVAWKLIPHCPQPCWFSFESQSRKQVNTSYQLYGFYNVFAGCSHWCSGDASCILW